MSTKANWEGGGGGAVEPTQCQFAFGNYKFIEMKSALDYRQLKVDSSKECTEYRQ